MGKRKGFETKTVWALQHFFYKDLVFNFLKFACSCVFAGLPAYTKAVSVTQQAVVSRITGRGGSVETTHDMEGVYGRKEVNPQRPAVGTNGKPAGNGTRSFPEPCSRWDPV